MAKTKTEVKRYDIELRCDNCRKVQAMQLPVGVDFEDYRTEYEYPSRIYSFFFKTNTGKRLTYKAGYSEKSRFVDVKCVNCGSCKLMKKMY